MDYFKRTIDFFTKGNFSEQGKQSFNKWIADDENSEKKERALHELWNSTEVNAYNDTKKSWKTFRRNVIEGNKSGRLKQLRLWQAAVAVLLLITISVLYFTYQFNSVDNYTDLIEQYIPVSETEYLVLSDGSEVHLNSGSLLIYPEKFTGDSRNVYLSGEANFKIKEDKEKPFIVKSNDIKVTVLGTEFDILAYPEDSLVSVTLLSGCVEASYKDLNENRILSPNQQLVYNKVSGLSYVHNPNIEDVTAWQRGELIFKGTTLNEVIKVLRRKYPYDFVYNESYFTNDKYTFKFKDNAPLTEVMEVIFQVVGYIDYQIDDDTCYIKFKKDNY